MTRFVVYVVDARTGDCQRMTERTTWQAARSVAASFCSTTRRPLVEDRITGSHYGISEDGSILPTVKFGEVEEAQSFFQKAKEKLTSVAEKFGLTKSEVAGTVIVGVARGLIAWLVFALVTRKRKPR